MAEMTTKDWIITGILVAAAGAVVWYFFPRDDDGEFILEAAVVDAALAECPACTCECTVDDQLVTYFALKTGMRLKPGPHELKMSLVDGDGALMQQFQYTFQIQLRQRTRLRITDDWQGEETVE